MGYFHFSLRAGECRTVELAGHEYTVGFEGGRMRLEAEEPFAGEIVEDITLCRDGLVFAFDREGERVSVRVYSRSGSLDRRSAEWRQLAMAFFALAHGDDKPFEELPERLTQTDEGMACQVYRETRDREDLDTAGRMIAGGRSWYAHLGRSL